MKIFNFEISKIKEYENNPRKNEEAVGAVAESIKNFGFKVPIVIDRDGVIVAGHTRKKAAEQLGLETVPCIVADDLTPEQAAAFRLADNKTGEIAEWDFEKLEAEIKALADFPVNMSNFGFAEYEEFKDLAEDDFDVEAEAAAITETETKAGDVWQLGRHRLICGDCTDAATLSRLMDGEKAHLFLTDPPYNIDYTGKTAERLTIQNDNMEVGKYREFLKAAFENANNYLREGAAFYIWHADSEGLHVRSACSMAGWKTRQCLIWAKNTLALGRQDYQWKHEPCLYGWKDGAAHYFTDSRTETTVIEDAPNINKMNKSELKAYIKELLNREPASTIIREDKPSRNGEHPTMKPLKLIGYQIKNSSRKNERVLDIFGGSGSTLIACEQLGRACYMAELDPKYCDVIKNRWEAATGQKAIKK